ncbi:MAG: twin-arginine translocation signal domain-containing protein, partial [Paracoccaceae bacterium]
MRDDITRTNPLDGDQTSPDTLTEASAEGAVVGRRGFLGLAGMTAALGVTIPFAHHIPAGLVPAAFAQETDDLAALLSEAGKHPGLSVIGDRPFVAETPEHLLDDDTTPLDKFFVRQNGIPPEP